MNLVYIQTANQGWHQLFLLAPLRVFVAQFHPLLTLIHRLWQGGGHRHLEAVITPTPNTQSGGSLCDL